MSGLLLTIRYFQAEDLGELHEIDRICFPEGIAFSRSELLSHLIQPQSIARVAQGSDGILGFVIAKVEAPFYAHIITLDVIPAARRRKIGTKLMNEVHHELENRNIGMVGLEVGVDNRKAQRLYGKLGYQRMGILSGYYRGREDAFRMMRRLKD